MQQFLQMCLIEIESPFYQVFLQKSHCFEKDFNFPSQILCIFASKYISLSSCQPISRQKSIIIVKYLLFTR